jgi:6-phosphogluconate dehydrogenase
MGANMVKRLMKAGHECVVYDSHGSAAADLAKEGATAATSLKDFVDKLKTPRSIWLMIPAGAMDAALDDLLPLLAADDTVIDGGNSYYRDDLRRAKSLKEKKIHYVDVGTSGGVAGLDRGYCLMIGGDDTAVGRLDPIFASLAPGHDAAPATPGRTKENGKTADLGYLHCGPNGAGHFVKMVHNGIEYGLMAAYAEGLNILHNADVGNREQVTDAETSPLRNPDDYRYELDLGEITEVWRRGSVISSWLLDLTAMALAKDSKLEGYAGRVSDSGEGRWTIEAAVDESVPAPVLSAALFSRFSSRGEDEFANKILSAMRHAFGGHVEKKS